MKVKKEKIESFKVRGFRMEDEIYNFIVSLKPRDKSWNLFFKELMEIIKKIKDL